jgi:hypothetical protein
MTAVSHSLTPSDVSIVTVEAVFPQEFEQNPTPSNLSPSFLPAANEGDEASRRQTGDRNGGRGPQRGGALALSGPQGIRGPRARCCARPAGCGRKTAPPTGLCQSMVGRGSPASDRAMARQRFGDVDRRRPRPNPFEHPGQAPLARSWRAGTQRARRPSHRPMPGDRIAVEADARHQTDSLPALGAEDRQGSGSRREPGGCLRGQNGSWAAMLRRMIGFQPSGLRGSAPLSSRNGC